MSKLELSAAKREYLDTLREEESAELQTAGVPVRRDDVILTLALGNSIQPKVEIQDGDTDKPLEIISLSPEQVAIILGDK